MEEDTMDIWRMIQEVEDPEERAILWKMYRGELIICKSCEETLIPRAVSQICDPCKEASGERAREYQREYNQRPEVKERMRKYQREYRQRPEVKARIREYEQRPEVKARRREYLQRPEVKKRERERNRKRRQERQEKEMQRVRERVRECNREYHQRKKAQEEE